MGSLGGGGSCWYSSRSEGALYHRMGMCARSYGALHHQRGERARSGGAALVGAQEERRGGGRLQALGLVVSSGAHDVSEWNHLKFIVHLFLVLMQSVVWVAYRMFTDVVG